MGKGKPFLGCAGRKKNGGHACRLPDTNCRYVVPDELDRIVDGQTCRNRSTRTVDVERNIAFRIFGFQKEQLSRNQIRNIVIDRYAYKYDAVIEQSGVDVVSALAPVRLLDNHWDQRVSFGAHLFTP